MFAMKGNVELMAAHLTARCSAARVLSSARGLRPGHLLLPGVEGAVEQEEVAGGLYKDAVKEGLDRLGVVQQDDRGARLRRRCPGRRPLAAARRRRRCRCRAA